MTTIPSPYFEHLRTKRGLSTVEQISLEMYDAGELDVQFIRWLDQTHAYRNSLTVQMWMVGGSALLFGVVFITFLILLP